MNAEATADSPDEFEALKTVYTTLEPLTAEGRNRVISYVVDRLGIADLAKASSTRSEGEDGEADSPSEQNDVPNGQNSFSTFAELHNAASPGTNAEHALVAAFWEQVHEGNETFGSQAVNTKLKDLGVVIKNITDAFNQLKGSKPALLLQLRKSGSSRQARKTYKLTEAGLKRVQEMLGE